LLRGIAELTAHDPERAVADLRTAVQHGIAFGGAWSLLGIASRATGDLASAESAFRKALELDPNDFDANVELGSLLLIDRDLEEAGRLIRRSIGLRPSSLPARYQLALLYVAQRKTGEAIQELEALRVAAPDWLEPHVQLTRLYYQVDRPLDGRRERELVEKLQAESQHDTLRRLSGSETVTSTPSPAIPDPSPRF
jgi:tetratricopeptide (TPR) repeat protein